MDKALVIIAAKAIKDVYDGHCENIGSTEFSLTMTWYNRKPLQVLAIGGSDETMDWIWNFILASWDNIKLCSYLSAKRIAKRVEINPDVPLLVTGHSKAGPTAPYYKLRYGADYCVSFCPAPGFRKAPEMKNTLMVIDPDDVVPDAGQLSFDHPICEVEYLPRDKEWHDIKGRLGDHSIEHVLEYLLEG